MDGESVKTLERIIKESMFVDVDGTKFGREGTGAIRPIFYEPRPAKVYLHTLTGFVDYIKSNVDKLNLKEHFIVVDNPEQVSFYSAVGGKDRDRDLVSLVKLDDKLQSYRFGNYEEVESFVVHLNSLFEESPDRERLIKFVSSVTGGAQFTLEDDGVTQVVAVRKGVSGAITKNESAPKIVALKPYRTFRDVEQPTSDFLMRLKLVDEEDHIVGVCLYEADGGRWRNTAVQTIKDFLKKELGELEVAIIA